MIIQHGGLIMKIRHDEMSQNPQCSSAHPADCGPMTLAYFGLDPNIVLNLQEMTRETGMHYNDITEILKQTGDDGKQLTGPIKVKLHHLTPKKEEQIDKILEDQEAVILFGMRANYIGHFFIYGKDKNGKPIIIDNQSGETYRGKENIYNFYTDEGFVSIGIFLATTYDEKYIFVDKQGLKRKNIFVKVKESYEGSTDHELSEMMTAAFSRSNSPEQISRKGARKLSFRKKRKHNRKSKRNNKKPKNHHSKKRQPIKKLSHSYTSSKLKKLHKNLKK